MPTIIIRDRFDRTGPVKLTLGSKSRNIVRNKKVVVSDAELEVLNHSHESNHIFVFPEVAHGGVVGTQRFSPSPGRDEESPRKGGNIGGASKGS